MSRASRRRRRACSGTDPASGRPVSVRMGRYGAFVQIGTKDDDEKPKFAGLRPGQKMDTHHARRRARPVQAAARARARRPRASPCPRTSAASGPYVRYGSKFVSIRGDDPYTITLERALRADRREEDRRREPADPRLSGRRHPGAERPLRPVRHGQEEEREDSEGPRAGRAHARGVPGACSRPRPSGARAACVAARQPRCPVRRGHGVRQRCRAAAAAKKTKKKTKKAARKRARRARRPRGNASPPEALHGRRRLAAGRQPGGGETPDA